MNQLRIRVVVVSYKILVGWTEGLLFDSFQILRKNGEARIYLKERNKQQEVRNLESDKKMPITYFSASGHNCTDTYA